MVATSAQSLSPPPRHRAHHSHWTRKGLDSRKGQRLLQTLRSGAHPIQSWGYLPRIFLILWTIVVLGRFLASFTETNFPSFASRPTLNVFEDCFRTLFVALVFVAMRVYYAKRSYRQSLSSLMLRPSSVQR